MGYNRSGQIRKMRLRRRKKHINRLIKKAEAQEKQAEKK